METTKIMFCTCKHPYQDKKYGLQSRVHNLAGKDTVVKYRCTVCGREK